MLIDFQEFRTLGLNQFDTLSAAAASTAKRLQAMADEATAFSKKRYEVTYALGGKLLSARGLHEIVEIQSDFAKSAYEDFVAEATKIGALYSELTKEAFRPGKVEKAAQNSPAASPPPAAPVLAKQAPTPQREQPEE